MRPLLTTGLLAFLVLLAAGCDAGDDTVGPGRPGDATVVAHEFVFDVDEADLSDDGLVLSAQYDVPDITLSVVEDGAVLAFYRAHDTWTALPYTYGVESADLPAVDYTVTLGYAYERRLLEVFYEVSTSAIDPRDLDSWEVKVVIIDGFYAGKTGIDLRDWEQVKEHFGLED